MKIKNYQDFILEEQISKILDSLQTTNESFSVIDKIWDSVKNSLKKLFKNSSNPFDSIKNLWNKFKFNSKLSYILISALIIGCGVTRQEIFKNFGYDDVQLVQTVNKVENEQSNQKSHLVQSGESLLTIAQKWGIKYPDLIHKNKLHTVTIRPGQVLLIPSAEEIKFYDETEQLPPDFEKVQSQLKEIESEETEKQSEEETKTAEKKPTKEKTIKETPSEIKTAEFKDGFFKHSSIVNKRIPGLELATMDKVNAIILHRTATQNLKGTLRGFAERKIGTHFLVDYDGKIYQTAGIDKITAHVGEIRPRCVKNKTATPEELEEFKEIGWSPLKVHYHEIKKNYPERYPYNSDAIGIEVMGEYDKGKNKWEKLTPKQIKSVKFLVNLLKSQCNLTEQDIYAHEDISYKTENEGGDVFDAIKK